MDLNPADSSKIMPESRRNVLQTYNLAGAEPFAVGMEAEVYAYKHSILKIYADASRLEHLNTLQNFYSMLNTTAATFSLPKITEVAQHGDLIVVIENRIDGAPLESMLPNLSPAQHEKAEALYLDAVFQLRNITIDKTPNTYLLFDQAKVSQTETQSFDDFYAHLLGQKVTRVGRFFATIHPNFAEKKRWLVDAISSNKTTTLSIVHGDFFPGNVLVNDTLTQVQGIIDFGSFTLFGNPLLDLAGAFGFYRMYDPNRVEIRERLLQKILKRLSKSEHPIFFQFLLANAILTSDLYANEPDPTRDGHFQWAYEILSTPAYWQSAQE